MGFVNVNQCKTIIKNYLSAGGRGGFVTGVVSSVTPLRIMLEGRLPLSESNLYVLDGVSGLTLNLKHKHASTPEALTKPVTLRAPLAAGDGVLLLTRPGTEQKQYILLGKMQPYAITKEVVADAAVSDIT